MNRFTAAECLALDFVQAEIENAAGAAALSARAALRRVVEARAVDQETPMESPLEIVFYAWWLALEESLNPFSFRLMPQKEVIANGHRYRPDFVVSGRGFQAKVVVELDGHAFHERTPEQVERRNTRDRDLQADGWRVFHFSGREIKTLPLRCVREVYVYVLADYFAVDAMDPATAKTNAAHFVDRAIEDMGLD